ncbi:hypothetical protein L7F22_057496 [Adiantum nelumboides]|nr:hypothetical protein [Adiantum nelumboides]
MADVELPDLSSPSSLQEFNEYLSGRSYRLLLPLRRPPAAEAEDENNELDLFGEEIEEEKKASAERDAQKAGNSSVLLDVKPWDDETDMVKLEEAVRSVSMPGLFWGASNVMSVGYDIKKLQIMMTTEDDLVFVDNIIKEYLTEEPRNEFMILLPSIKPQL